jgi:hypothetical protein
MDDSCCYCIEVCAPIIDKNETKKEVRLWVSDLSEKIGEFSIILLFWEYLVTLEEMC